jgi:hypothetical protein
LAVPESRWEESATGSASGVRRWPLGGGLLFVSLVLLLLSSCSPGEGAGTEVPGISSLTGASSTSQPTAASADATLNTPQVDLTLAEKDVTMKPLPLRAGSPFTVTAVIHNNSALTVRDVPFMICILAPQEEIGYMPFSEVLTVTLQPTQSLAVEVPVDWNFAGGEHRLWVQVNRLPDAWQARSPTYPEADISDNIVLLDVMIDPFDAYASDLCSGRTDVEIGPEDVLPEPDQQQVLVRVHNTGNRAMYSLPVIVMGDQLSGIAYTPVILPCGGTAEVQVRVDRPFGEGESLTVQVNPGEWKDRVEEDDFDNNRVTVDAGLAPGMVVPPGSGLEDYDFSIGTADIESPELWIVMVTVHNLGTRDAAAVPIRVQNEAGRKINDVIPSVQGNGVGVAAIRVGYLWTKGGTLTFTINPEDAKGSYPESDRLNNVTTFTLP